MTSPPKDTFIGRCRHCKGTVRIVAPIVIQFKTQYIGPKSIIYVRELPNRERSNGLNEFYSRCLCGHDVKFLLLRGQHSSEPCTSHCRKSKEPLCDCACGGHNHGKAYEA